MSESAANVCVIIGASHAGVNSAFSLRRAGWEGKIQLVDAEPHLPYHRPPLSKAFLTESEEEEKYLLKPASAYEKSDITLTLGTRVAHINRADHHLVLENGEILPYDKLILATGARPFIPPIPGLKTSPRVFAMRTVTDAQNIRAALESSPKKRAIIIGGGYIGLETAASLHKLGASVCVLERESRVLARVTSPEMSSFFQQLHEEKGVTILTGKNVVSVAETEECERVTCEDGSEFEADVIVVGVGIRVNAELASEAGLEVQQGICVDKRCRTLDPDIFAIGDCTWHPSALYGRNVRLESVQNAADQAKVVAAVICGKDATYDALPWFWSDQYDVKLQIAGLSQGYEEALVRREAAGSGKFSVWYFQGEKLLAVDAINHPKAYVLGMRFLKGQTKVNKAALVDPATELKPAALTMDA